MDRRLGLQVSLAILVAASVTACGGGAAPSGPPSVAAGGPQAIAGPSSTPLISTPASAAATTSAAPTETPAASRSHKPLPSIDQTELDAYLTSSITLLDLADADLSVVVGYLDPTSGEAIDLGTYDLGSTEQLTDQVPPGTFKLQFRMPGSSTPQTCTIEIGDKDAITFVAVEGAVAIGKAGSKPASAGELFVVTSSLCGR
jgi:hypothetical protein